MSSVYVLFEGARRISIHAVRYQNMGLVSKGFDLRCRSVVCKRVVCSSTDTQVLFALYDGSAQICRECFEQAPSGVSVRFAAGCEWPWQYGALLA